MRVQGQGSPGEPHCQQALGAVVGMGSALCRRGLGETAEPRTELGPLTPTEGLSQLHQAAAAAEQHPPVHLWDLRLQPDLRLHREYRNRVPCRSPPCHQGPAVGSLALGQVLLAHSLLLLQNVQHFSLERDASGKVVLEDGKGRCPFDPEYRSTAVMVGKARHPGTLALPAVPLWSPHPPCSALGPLPSSPCLLSPRLPGQAAPRPGYLSPSGTQGCAGGAWGSQQDRVFGRRRALRRDRQQLPGQRADHLPQPGEPHRPQDRELPQLAAR